MNRKIPALAIAAAALFGLSACSGGSASVEEKPVAEAPAAEETPSEESMTEADATAVQACLDLIGPFAEANSAMMGIVADGKLPPQDVVDMWTSLVDALGKVANTASNPEVKTAAAVAHSDFAALRDAMQRVYVEGDITAMGDYAAAVSAIETSYTALLALCSTETTE